MFVNPRLVDDFLPVMRLADNMMGPSAFPPWDEGRSIGDGHNTLSRRHADTEVHNTDKEFRIRLNLQHYQPEEVKITSEKGRIVINAKHEEKQDHHGYVSREMTRSYKLPDDVDAHSVTSTMNSHGILSIRAQKNAIEGPKEVPIAVEYKGHR